MARERAPNLELRGEAPAAICLDEGLVRALRVGLRLAVVAWLAASLCPAIKSMEVRMDFAVTLKVHGEAGVGGGAGLGKRETTRATAAEGRSAVV